MRVLVLGASGMLGHAMLHILDEPGQLDVYGTLRSTAAKRFFPPELGGRLLSGIEAENQDVLTRLFRALRPDVLINCVGLVKQLEDANDPLRALPVNAMLPHRLAGLCELAGARLVHVSTDCVFSGEKGDYREEDRPDATDLYGLSKYLGEVDYPHAVTLRTSIIGPELTGARGLIGWFLAQRESCPGFTRAVFSGLPTVVLAQIVRDVIIPRSELHGLYHVAARPIAKFDLLRLVADVYGKSIEIVPVDSPVIDRSLNAERFRGATGYVVPQWPELIATMHSYSQKMAKQDHVQG
jgi:dTDP-4-dehydrorhamnose reductase